MLLLILNASIVIGALLYLVGVYTFPVSASRETMAGPAFLDGESLALILQGTVSGAVLAVLFGFAWGGWIRGTSAIQQAEEQSNMTLVSVLAPICVDKFKSYQKSAANITAPNQQSSTQTFPVHRRRRLDNIAT